MKKGINYIDWVIAIGIFIVYIIFIFVVFKPGIRDPSSPSYMLDIVKTNFIKETYYSIEIVNLFVKPDSDGQKIYLIQKLPFSWQNGRVLMKEGNNNINIEIDNSVNPPALEFQDTFSANIEKEYKLIYNPELSLQPVSISQTDILTDYRFGVKQNLFGVSLSNITKLGAKDYQAVKSAWHFPLSKEFNIEIKKIEDQSILLNFPGNTPTSDVKVFVINYNDNVIQDEGTKTPVLVTLKTW